MTPADAHSLACSQCGAANSYSAQSPIGRRDTCTKCGADLHTCKNCEFYDPSAYRECREQVAEGVREKDRSNFCDSFRAKSAAGGAAPGNSKEDLLKKAQDLFKKL